MTGIGLWSISIAAGDIFDLEFETLYHQKSEKVEKWTYEELGLGLKLE